MLLKPNTNGYEFKTSGGWGSTLHKKCTGYVYSGTDEKSNSLFDVERVFGFL
jgi:hypothetical protein